MENKEFEEVIKIDIVGKKLLEEINKKVIIFSDLELFHFLATYNQKTKEIELNLSNNVFLPEKKQEILNTALKSGEIIFSLGDYAYFSEYSSPNINLFINNKGKLSYLFEIDEMSQKEQKKIKTIRDNLIITLVKNHFQETFPKSKKFYFVLGNHDYQLEDILLKIKKSYYGKFKLKNINLLNAPKPIKLGKFLFFSLNCHKDCDIEQNFLEQFKVIEKYLKHKQYNNLIKVLLCHLPSDITHKNRGNKQLREFIIKNGFDFHFYGHCKNYYGKQTLNSFQYIHNNTLKILRTCNVHIDV